VPCDEVDQRCLQSFALIALDLLGIQPVCARGQASVVCILKTSV